MELEQLKHSSLTKALLLLNLPQNTRINVKCWDHRDKTKGISQINYRNLASTTYKLPNFWIFCCKIKIAEKIKLLFTSGFDSNIILVLRFKNSNTFYCVQSAKIVKSDCRISFCPRQPNFPQLKNFYFLVTSP